MNAQLPPTDPLLRKQLARRSAGRLPANLLAETTARLDAAPRRAGRDAPAALRMPRLAWAGVGVAAAALLAVALALPALRPTPAGFVSGYPAQRALNTAEMAALMAGPELAQNTTIVASVTITENLDVCPMNSRPTVGVIEGMRSQVCVMGSSLADRLSTPTATGIFAFRYMAPGYLAFLGEVTPASSRLAFRVTEKWPLQRQAFLVEGYLGSTALPCDSTLTIPPADYLQPASAEPCAWSWLSEDGSAAAVQSFATWSPGATPSPEPSYDVLLALDGKARHVEAGIVRQLDSVPAGATTHGVYVVEAVTGPCPWTAPYDSRGCATWRVLAKVPELSLPDPNYTPTPTPSPTAPPLIEPQGLLGPGNEPLTLTQVVDLMQADPDHLAGWTVVMDAPFGSGVACPDEPGGQCGALKDLRESQGTWAVRIQSDGLFGNMGEVRKSSSGKLVSSLSEAASDTQPYLRVVDAWLHAETLPCATAEPTPGSVDCRPVETAWLTPDGTDLSATRANVQTGAYDAFIGGSGRSPAHGIYLLSPNLLLARFAPEGFRPGPSVSPPATPIPEPSTGTYVGLIGEGGRPLTVAEFTDAWVTNRLAGRVAVVKGPLSTRSMCLDAGAADASALPGTCHSGVLEDSFVPEGYWAVRVETDGALTLFGELTMNGTLFVWSVDQVIKSKSLEPDDLLIVQGTATPWRLDPCDMPGPCTYWPRLQGASGQLLPSGTPTWEDIAGQESGPPLTGFFLVRRGSDTVTILAAFELAYPPD